MLTNRPEGENRPPSRRRMLRTILIYYFNNAIILILRGSAALEHIFDVSHGRSGPLERNFSIFEILENHVSAGVKIIENHLEYQ